ncbi:MAG TPA: choice-of-anchor tandem repeat GloVer-containing protein [Terriglobales bacterium]|nr:choice-of-anchor tandem repeat GloVer-containing protein [Terriglobales bacterium]
MRFTQICYPLVSATASSVLALTLAIPSWSAPRYKVLHAFTGGNDGGGLWGSLVLDKQGNVYGTTVAGGRKGKGGTAFELSRQANGVWSQTVLYNFCSLSDCTDGGGSTAGLIFDAAGNLYGTTESGGSHVYGTVFKLTAGSGAWKETVLHSFRFNQYGCCPKASLVMDNKGNLFGTASVAFELSPGAEDWKETVLHHFTGQHGDGSDAYAGLILDAAGNLYGQTEMGGSDRCGGGCGTVYQLTPTSDGKWKENVLHRFQARWDGSSPVGALLLDGTGNLYGTAGGGNAAHGVVFRLSLDADGRWRETVVYNLLGGSDGDQPGGGVAMDKVGNLYGTTVAGGDPNCDCGVVFKLAPGSDGKWSYTVLHRFLGSDGAQPAAAPILDSKGSLYGTTITGGSGGAGVVFEITP